MNRQKAIIGATLMLVVCAIAYWVWSNWGLITVDVNAKPLAEVIRSIEKQGGIVLKTNMDATKPVTMHVHKVPLTDALETLAGVTDSRWRLGYFFASDAGTLKSAFEMIASGKRPEGWKNFEVPLFGGIGDEAIPMDPRRDTWAVKAPEEKTLQAFLQAASAGVSASFTCPESFNPAISSTPSSGQIRKSASQLAKAAGAKMEEVFLLMGRPVGVVEADNRDDDDGISGGSRGGGRGSFGGRSGGSGGPNFTLMRDRQLAEIAKLPASEQTSAKAEFDEREKLYTSLRDLSDDERRAKMNDYMNNPDNQQRMADRMNKSNERKTPDQRLAKYQRYVAKKQAIISSRTK